MNHNRYFVYLSRSKVRCVHRLTATLAFSLLVSCSGKQKYDEQFPKEQISDWQTYEGRIPLSEKSSLYQILALRPTSNAGDGEYKLEEFVEEEGSQRPVSSFAGAYSTYYSGDDQTVVEIHLHNSSQLTGVTRAYRIDNGKRIREEQFRRKDLMLMRKNDNTLIVLNYDHEPITKELSFNLSRRVSNVFTIEGKFAHVGDSSVFYEMNTEEVLPVAKLGAYDQAIRQYHQLANEKNEGVYLKGTAFLVNWPGRKGETHAVVFKRIISMSNAVE